MIGFAATKAPVVTFLDAHCEVNIGWLEPLLERIYHDKSTVVCPEIDVISDENFEYQHGPSGIMRGIFNWDLHFRWRAVSQEEQKRRKSQTDPVRYIRLCNEQLLKFIIYFKALDV